MIKKILITALMFLSLASTGVFASIADNLKFNGYIADQAEVLSEEMEADINRTLHDLNKKTKAAIAVVTVKSLEGENIDTLNENILKTYQIADAEMKNGIVFLVVVEDHQLQLLLDQGLVGEVKPEELKEIVNKDIIPFFQKAEYDKGIMKGTYVMADRVAGVYDKTIEHFGKIPKPKSIFSNFNKNWLWLLIIPILGIIGGIIYSVAAKKQKEENSKPENEI